MTKKEAIERFVETRFSAIPQEWVQIVAEQKGAEIYAWPMWGTMWFVDRIWGEHFLKIANPIQDEDENKPHYDEEMVGNFNIPDKDGNDTAAYIFEIEGEYILGINGAGWNFYNGVWDVLYDTLGLKWHDKDDITSKELGELLSSEDETIKRNAMSILKQLQKK